MNWLQRLIELLRQPSCEARLAEQEERSRAAITGLVEQIANLTERKSLPLPPPEPKVLSMMTRETVGKLVAATLSSPNMRDAYYTLIDVESFREFLVWSKVWKLNRWDGIVRIGERQDCDDFVRVLLGDLSKNRDWARIPCGSITYTNQSGSHMAVVAVLGNPSLTLYHVEPQERPDKAIGLFPIPGIKEVISLGWL